MNRYALFLGCTTPRYVFQYELSSRWVLKQLGIELIDIDDFACCGFNQIDLNKETGLLLAAMNLAVAEARGLNILTLCTSCAGALAEAAKKLRADPKKREGVNSKLQTVALEYRGNIEVKHISRVLYEDIGVEKIEEAVKTDLSGLRAAPHYGCHYLKPEWISAGFDEPDAPQTLHQLISATGAVPISYETSNLCCGGKTFPISRDTTLSLVNRKLNNLKTKEIDCMVLQCPTCYLMYGEMQKQINKRFGEEHEVPVLLYPQLLGLALGGNPQTDLGLDLNAIPLDGIMARIAKSDQD